MRPIDEIIVHCAATPEGKPFSVKDIDAWHRARGWSGIGYHRVCYLDGTIHDGRAIEKIGAHVAGRNSRTLGIVYIGGCAGDGVTAKDTRTRAQADALRDELIELGRRFDVKKISGHRDYAAKACPSFDATHEYRDLLTSPGTLDEEAMADGILERGETGVAVAAWQGDIDRWRDLTDYRWGMPVTGAFDHTLELATIHFQKARGIVGDGKVGPQTRDEMALALAGKPPFSAIPENDENTDILAAVAKLKGALGNLGHPV